MLHQAVGMVEVYGLVAAFAACDAGAKAGNVTVEKFDKNKPANADSLPVPSADAYINHQCQIQSEHTALL